MRILASTIGLVAVSVLLLGTTAPASAAVSEPRSVSAGVDPKRLAVTPDGAQTWILGSTSNELIGYTTGATLTNIASWPLPGTDYGSANVAILSDGWRAIVSDASGDQVNIVDLTTGTVTNPPTLNGSDPRDLALSPDGSKVAISYSGGGSPSVAVFNTSDWSYVWSWIFFNEELSGLAFSPDSSHFAAIASALSTVYLVDLTSFGDFVVVNAPDTPSSVAYSSDGESIFVGSFAYSSIRKFEALTGTELLSVFTERTAFLAVSPDGTQLWASQPVAAKVSVYNTSNLSIVQGIPLTGNPNGIAFAQFGCQAWVAQQFAGVAQVFDLDPCLPGPALPATGASQTLVITLASIGSGLLILGVLAVILVRRRNTRQSR